MYIDIHTHILPNVDDGAKSMNEALEILRTLKRRGIEAVALTPHFYPHSENSIHDYKARIDERFCEIKKELSPDIPELFLGSEVFTFDGISGMEEVKNLCIGNSNHAIIELPYSKITSKTVEDIISLNLKFGIVPILAHIERYSRFDNFREVLALISDGYAKGQVNADSLLHFKTRRDALGLIHGGFVHFIASDTHSLKLMPDIKEALNVVRRKLGPGYVEHIEESYDILYSKIKNG